MTTNSYLDASSPLRYAVRDKLKTRYSDTELLTHLNEAIRTVARDTRYFRARFIIQVEAHKSTYKLDYRIIRVNEVYTEGCKLTISSATEDCNRTSENHIEYVALSNETKSLRVVPTLTDPLYKPTDFDKIVIDEGADIVGVPMYLDENGNATPILGASAAYKEMALYAEYYPKLELNTDVPESVLDIAEIINIATVVIVTANSSVTATQRIHSQAHARYKILLRDFKKVANNKHAQAEYNSTYRTPFTRKRKTRKKDF